MDNRELILVTGANGFIGGWITEAIYLRELAKVRAGIRRWSSAARIARFPVEIACCNVLDNESIAHALQGVQCVIHCAVGARDVTVQGTENMLKASLASGVRRFIHVSTCEVYGQPSGKIDESYPYQYTGSQYADAKIEAEKLCWEYCSRGLAVTVVRPPIVYGPFSTDWTVKLTSRLQSGNWGIFKAEGEGICNLIYIADLIDGVLLATDCEAAVGEAFNLNGPETVTWNQYFASLNMALGLPELKQIEPHRARLRSAVFAPARSAAKYILAHMRTPLRQLSQNSRPARLAMQRAERVLTAPPRSAELSLYSRDAVYLSTKARDTLGYRPRVTVEQGVELSVQWLKLLGLAR